MATYKLVISLAAAALLFMQASADALPAAPLVAAVQSEQSDQNDQGEQTESEPQGKDRGVLQADIVSVDYARGILHVQAARQGKIDIQILPSTSIVRRGDQYGTIADLAPGVRVSIYVSEVAGHLTAQIIRIH